MPPQQYNAARIFPSSSPISPFILFEQWYKAAKQSDHEPESFTLATVNQNNEPNARTVLLKKFDHQSITFFTNYTSQKSQELAHNPRCAVNFHWKNAERAVRMKGIATKCSKIENEQYFHSRPRESQIGAWASRQSTVINEDTLDIRMKHLHTKYGTDLPIPCPDFWGGWKIIPR